MFISMRPVPLDNFSEVCGIYCDLFVLQATGLYTFEQAFDMLDMILFWMVPSNNKTILVLKVGIVSCHKMDVTDTGYTLLKMSCQALRAFLHQISMHLQLKELLNTNNVIFQVRQTEWNGRKCSDYSQKGATPPWLAYFYEEETGCCWKNDCFSARNMARTQPPCRVMAHGKPNTSMKLYFRGHVCCHQIILWRKLQQH